MRRERSPVAGGVWTLVLAAGVLSWSCNSGSPPATSPPATSAPATKPAASIDLGATDVYSGCDHGAPHVKVLIQLMPTPTGGCKAQVTPASVCVAPEGRVHFKVKSDCDRTARALVTEPKLKRTGDGSIPVRPGSLPACALEFDPVGNGQSSSRQCDVAPNAEEGHYEYAVEGEGIEALDPDIEVRR